MCDEPEIPDHLNRECLSFTKSARKLDYESSVVGKHAFSTIQQKRCEGTGTLGSITDGTIHLKEENGVLEREGEKTTRRQFL